MKNVAIYCRLSAEDDDKRATTDDSDSIQNQKSMLITYAMERGWNVYKIYSDDDYSGVDKKRPEFNQMIADCESGKIDIVLCKTQSRFSRDMAIIEEYIHDKFLEWNIRFVSVVDNADTEVKGNKKARQINGLINEWYLEDLSDNIKKTLKHMRESGKRTSGHAPYGYAKSLDDKHKLIIDPVAAEVVKNIFNMYKSGLGWNKIVGVLNDSNILNPYKYKSQNGLRIRKDYTTELWNIGTIRYILNNEVYIGNLVQGKRQKISYKNTKVKTNARDECVITVNAHEPIIDTETWTAVQERLASVSRPLKKSGEIHIFSQKVYCAECGKVFAKTASWKNNGKKFEYVRCKGYYDKSMNCSNSKYMPYSKLEEIALNEINSLLEKYAEDECILDKISYDNNIDSSIIALESEHKDLSATISKKQSYFRALYEDKLNGLLSEEDFVNIKVGFQNDIAKAEERISIISDKIRKYDLKKSKIESKSDIISKYKRIEILDRNIIDEFIDNIKIGSCIEGNEFREIAIQWAV